MMEVWKVCNICPDLHCQADSRVNADYILSSTLEARPHHQLQVGNSPDSHTWLSLLSRYTERLGEKFGLVQPSTNSGSDNVKRFLLPGTLNGEYAVDASMQDEVRCSVLGTRTVAELLPVGRFTQPTSTRWQTLQALSRVESRMSALLACARLLIALGTNRRSSPRQRR